MSESNLVMPYMSDYDTILQYVTKRKNLLIIGEHGVGKTYMVRKAFKAVFGDNPTRMFSSATLDPFADLVGVPYPVKVKNKRYLQFIRQMDLFNAYAIFFDELTRAHPKVLNAVMELIQFFSINNELFPNLKVIIGAMNPPNDDNYKGTHELDIALRDRFYGCIQVKANASVEALMEAGCVEDTAKKVVTWWVNAGPAIKKAVSPRRLEIICKLWDDGMDINHALNKDLLGVVVPVQPLFAILGNQITAETLVVKSGNMTANWFHMYGHEAIRMAEGHDSEQIASALKAMKVKDIATLGKLLLTFPQELQHNVFAYHEHKINEFRDIGSPEYTDFGKWVTVVRNSIKTK